MRTVDAVVVGAGPNGLVAANLLASAGWDVVVLEAEPEPGGAVRSDAGLGEGHVADVCSGFYPLAVASPAIAGLGLEAHGLTWRWAPAVLGHALGDEAVVLEADPAATAAGLEAARPGQARAWTDLVSRFGPLAGELLGALLGPFPPVRAAGRLGARGSLRLARLALLPLRRLVEEERLGPEAAALLAGCALHADLGPDEAGSAFFGLLLALLGQRHGFPVPEGGASQLSGALVARLVAAGGELVCGEAVAEVRVVAGRAVGVTTTAGRTVFARRAVLADVAATALYGELVGPEHLPGGLAEDLARVALDRPVVKLDLALSAPLAFSAPTLGRAGVVHLAGSLDELAASQLALASGRVPALPFVLVGRPSLADPTRSASGEALWAYARAPYRAAADPALVEATGAAIEARLEAHAPGLSRLVTARRLLGPAELAAHDANLVAGSINGGTAAPFQQLALRPTPGLGRPETPIARLYLASASAHPGGGVHGAAGANAARAALEAARPVRALAQAGWRRLVF